MYLYKMTNKINGKIFVGRAIPSLDESISRHSRAETSIGNAIREYGLMNFLIEILAESSDDKELERLEQEFIRKLNCQTPNGYNVLIKPILAVKDGATAAKIFKAVDDEKRWQILNDLRDGEKCACDILEKMKISQPTLSHHMKILCDSGIVKARREGKWTHYSINGAGLREAINLLQSFDR